MGKIKANRRSQKGKLGHFYGRHHTPETIKKIKEHHAGYWLGRKHSKESIKRMKEHVFSEEHRKNLSKAQRGSKRPNYKIHFPSEETKEKIRRSAHRERLVAWIKFNCDFCGKLNEEIPSSYKATKRHFCNEECLAMFYKEKCPIEEQRAWKGGITPINIQLRKKFMEEIRKQVLERDNYTCLMCGQRGGTLHVDHIQSWKNYIDLRFDMNNCRTLCIGCHYFVTFSRPMPKDMKTWGGSPKSSRQDLL